MEGWLKLYRKVSDWEFFKEPGFLQVWVTLLVRANHHETEWRNMKIMPGQIVTGRKQIAEWSGVKERRVRTILTRLSTGQQIAIKSTNKFSVITIMNWDSYQFKESGGGPSNSPKTCSASATSKKKEERNKNNILSGKLENDTPVLQAREVVDHLNNVLGTKYRHDAKKTLSLLKARFVDGFTVEQIKLAISAKAKEWMGTERRRYLRPETLFGNKLEAYVQESLIEKRETEKAKAVFEELGPSTVTGELEW